MSLSIKRHVAKKVSPIEEQSFGTIKKLKRKKPNLLPICEFIEKPPTLIITRLFFYLDILIISYVDSFKNIVNM